MVKDTSIDNRYKIHHATQSDQKAIIEFIDTNWKKGHIFTYCKQLLDWQYFNKYTKQYNFILGIEQESGDIHGLLGFIPLSQFDKEIEPSRLCWMAIWKVKDDARGYKLGRHLMSFVETTINPDVFSTVAASSMTLPMYQAKGFITGTLNHYFILNPSKSPYQLICADKIDYTQSMKVINNPNKSLIPISDVDIRNITDVFYSQEELPKKSPEYLINRYMKHPFYKYQVYGICERKNIFGLIVIRICSYRESRAIRIVDFIGPSKILAGLQSEWMRLLKSKEAEYIDFYNAGINEEDLHLSGFVCRCHDNPIVIPNYFEPFLKKNIEIDYAIKLPIGYPYRIVKGDSDQDRPSLALFPNHLV